MNLKKTLVVNIITCLIIFFFFEITFFFKGKQAENAVHSKFINIPKNITYNELIQINDENIDLNDFPQGQYNSGKNFTNNNNSIILIGCSFSYSWGLKYKDTFAYQLSQKTKRPVYIRSRAGSGPNESLLILSNEKFYSSNEEPEYIIYLFIENHFSRMFSRIYSIQDNKLRPLWNIDKNFNAKQVICWYKPLFLSHIFKYIYREKVTLNYGIVDEEQYFKTMMAMKKEINKNWQNTKFVIIRYSEPNMEKPYSFIPDITKKFIENNIILIDADELIFGKTGKRLIGDKYMQEDQHPSALAFDLLTTALSKEINQKKI